MKKSEPKIILNVQIENNELEEKVKIAMDKYVEDVMLKNLDDKVQHIVSTRINRLINANYWSPDGKIGGMPLEDYVRQATEKTIQEVIEKNIKAIFAKKVAEMI